MGATLFDRRRVEIDELSHFQRARLTWRLLRDPRVPGWMKAALPIVASTYVVVPIDVIPDFIVGVGQIDDVSVIGFLIYAATKLIPRIAPRQLVIEHSADLKASTSSSRANRQVVDVSYRIVDSRGEDSSDRWNEANSRSVG